MSVLSPNVEASILAQIGIFPEQDAAEFDEALRMLERMWAEGKSAREFQAAWKNEKRYAHYREQLEARRIPPR